MTMCDHYCDVMMGAMASQITSLTIVYSTVHSGADQRNYQSPASLAFVNSPHKWPVTRKMSPFDNAIMWLFESLMLSDGHSWYHLSHSITLCRPATNLTTTWVQMSWILLRCPRCNRNTLYLKGKHYICASNVDQCTIFKHKHHICRSKWRSMSHI